MNAFQSIPANIRTGLYLLYSIVALVLGGCQFVDVTEIGGVPVEQLLALLAYIGVAFGFTAAANVSKTEDRVFIRRDLDPELEETPPEGGW